MAYHKYYKGKCFKDYTHIIYWVYRVSQKKNVIENCMEAVFI